MGQIKGIDMERTYIDNFLIGFSVGAIVGLLFAPYAGAKTRARITKAAADGTVSVKRHGEAIRDAALGAVEEGKNQIARHKEGVVKGIKRSAEAYRQGHRSPVTSSRFNYGTTGR